MDVRSINEMHHIFRWGSMLPIAVGFSKSVIYTTRKQLPLKIALSLFITLSIVNSLQANESRVLFLKSGSAPVYNSIINTAKQRVNRICKSTDKKCDKPLFTVESIQNKKLRTIIRDNKWDLIITIGTKAALKLNNIKTAVPTLYSLIPSHIYPAIRRSSTSKIKSAIYIDQPLKKQLQLIKASLPKKRKVGVLLGKYSGINKKHLQQVMRNMGLEPIVVNTNPNNLKHSLETVFGKADALLAQPDPNIYNKKTVMTVLLSSYRHKVPVFGYSAAFVRSGATAAIFSSPTNVGQQVGDEIVKYISPNNGTLSSPGFPKYFSVDTNRRVIRSLNIKLPATKTINARIMKAR
jgi:putative tryptophan/tyrosine transport system substrate-binding protein